MKNILLVATFMHFIIFSTSASAYCISGASLYCSCSKLGSFQKGGVPIGSYSDCETKCGGLFKMYPAYVACCNATSCSEWRQAA